MNVAIFTDTYAPDINGVVTSVMILEQELIKHGHNVYIVTSSDHTTITRENNLIKLPGISIKKLYGYNVSGFYSRKALKYLNDLDLDIIHGQTEFGIGIFARIAALRLNLPLVYTYHTMYEDYTHYLTRYTKGHFKKTMQKTIAYSTKVWADSTTQLVVPSYKTADAMFRYGLKNSVNVVPTGIKLDQFDIKNRDETLMKQYKEQFNIQPDDFIIINLGRIAPEKNTIEIVEAFEIIKAKGYNHIKLLIVGTGPSLDTLKEKVKEDNLDNITIAGRIEHDLVANVFALANVFVSTSITETQGLTFLEAMASGLFVICRKDKNLLGLIKEDYNGFFIEDAATLADKIIEASQYDSKQLEDLKEHALLTAQNYSSEQFYKKMMVVYENAIKSLRNKQMAFNNENNEVNKSKKII